MSNPPCLVTIDRDPRSLGTAATDSDVEQYRLRLEDLLGREFPDRQIRVATGSVVGSTCNDPDVSRRVARLETSDEWIDLVGDAPASE